MLKEQEARKILTAIREDFPNASELVRNHMLEIIDLAIECSEQLTGKRPSEEKSKAIVAQLKSFLQILAMEQS